MSKYYEKKRVSIFKYLIDHSTFVKEGQEDQIVRMPVWKIAEDLHISKSSVWRALNQLVRKGLIKRCHQPYNSTNIYKIINKVDEKLKEKSQLIAKKKAEYNELERKYEIFQEAYEARLDKLLYEIEDLLGHEWEVGE